MDMTSGVEPAMAGSASDNPLPAALHRWIASIGYRRDDGSVDTIVRGMHELSELHDIVERGPNFYAISGIVIGPARHAEPLTLEQADAL